MNKKILTIVGVLLLVIGIGVFVKTKSKPEVATEAPKTKKNKDN